MVCKDGGDGAIAETDFVVEIIFSPSWDLLRLDGLSKLWRGSAWVLWVDRRAVPSWRMRAWRGMGEDTGWRENEEGGGCRASGRIVELFEMWRRPTHVRKYIITFLPRFVNVFHLYLSEP